MHNSIPLSTPSPVIFPSGRVLFLQQFPDGERRVGICEASVFCGQPKNYLTRMKSACPCQYQEIVSLGFSGATRVCQSRSKRKTSGASKVKTISLRDFVILAALIYRKRQNPETQEILSLAQNTLSEWGRLSGLTTKILLSSKPIQIKRQRVEAAIEKAFVEYSGGQPQVVCPAGKIDVLTHDEVIEIKEATQWKAALGQVLAYSAFYPNHGARLHLFGPSSAQTKKLIESVCTGQGVTVTWDMPFK